MTKQRVYLNLYLKNHFLDLVELLFGLWVFENFLPMAHSKLIAQIGLQSVGEQITTTGGVYKLPQIP